jgi:isopenicillin-N N-acyltransferase-like protein
MRKIRYLRVDGSPYEMGHTHGKAHRAEIELLTEERLRLSSDPFWTGGLAITHRAVLARGEACLAAHEAFAPELVDEIRGMSDATGLGINELVIMNGFTDFVDLMANPAPARANDHVDDEIGAEIGAEIGDGDGGGCTAFMVDERATADGRSYIGQTWDMHTTATPHVLMLEVQPAGAPAAMCFTITGCVGMIGMNEHGVAVGINNLLDKAGRIGVHWVFVIRKMLAQATVDAALAVLQQAPLSGAHNYVLMGPDDAGVLRGYNVEAMASRQHVTPLVGSLAHTNHCVAPENCQVERPRKAYSLASTETRLSQAEQFLADHHGAITPQALIELTRYHADQGPSVCAHAVPDYHIESSGACIMSPTTRELWAVWGPPCENEYERFVVAGQSVEAGD